MLLVTVCGQNLKCKHAKVYNQLLYLSPVVADLNDSLLVTYDLKILGDRYICTLEVF